MEVNAYVHSAHTQSGRPMVTISNTVVSLTGAFVSLLIWVKAHCAHAHLLVVYLTASFLFLPVPA
jgi:hypothetical protein